MRGDRPKRSKRWHETRAPFPSLSLSSSPCVGFLFQGLGFRPVLHGWRPEPLLPRLLRARPDPFCMHGSSDTGPFFLEKKSNTDLFCGYLSMRDGSMALLHFFSIFCFPFRPDVSIEIDRCAEPCGCNCFISRISKLQSMHAVYTTTPTRPGGPRVFTKYVGAAWSSLPPYRGSEALQYL